MADETPDILLQKLLELVWDESGAEPALWDALGASQASGEGKIRITVTPDREIACDGSRH